MCCACCCCCTGGNPGVSGAIGGLGDEVDDEGVGMDPEAAVKVPPGPLCKAIADGFKFLSLTLCSK